ncbi:MAG: SPOR domain-containing protein [Thioalkalivibrionaceae bacterium]
MAKARRRTSSRSSRAGVPAWFWLLLGLGVGVALAAVFYLQGADRVLLHQVQSPTRDAREVRDVDSAPVTPLASAAPERPRFEYQDILPRDRVETPRPPSAGIEVPGAEIRWATPPQTTQDREPSVTAALPTQPPAAPAPAAPATESRTPTSSGISLQTGSFQRPEQAEQRRAELILLGLPTQTRKVVINDREWHRVFVGPFASDDEARRAEARLRAQNIDALRVSQP